MTLQSSIRHLLLKPALLACAVAGADAAHAQDSAAAAGQLEEVTITAEKTEGSLQKTPVSVTAVGAEQLTAKGISDPADLQSLVPNVEFQPIFNLLVFVRGVGGYDLQPGVDGSIAYNLDGNYISHQYGLPPLLFDLDRVEVLRGPQGTLYGHNSTGGAVNLVASKPTEELEGRVSLGGGNFSLFTSDAMLNVPVNDRLAVRAAFATSKHDGYLDNGFMDGDNIAGRIRLLATPTDDLDILLTADYSKKNENGSSSSVCPRGTDVTLFPLCAGVPWRPFTGLPGQGSDPVTSIVRPNLYDTTNSGVYAQIDWRLGWGTFTYVPTYRYVSYDNVQTYSQLFGYAPSARNKLLTNELRLTSPAGSALSWVGGLYYSDEDSRDHVEVLSGFGTNVNGTASIYDLFKYKSTSFSAFGQATLPIQERFRLTAGVRYTDDKKSTRGQAAAYCLNGTGGPDNPLCPASVPDAPALITAPTGAEQGHKSWTWKAGAEMDLTPTSLLYASGSSGFKTGGVNQIPVGFSAPLTYGPEKIQAIQLGSKNRFFGNRVQVNAEVFHYDYEGYQTLGFVVLPGSILSFVTVNSQTAEFYGGEVESIFLPTANDRIDLSVSALRARFLTFNVPSIGIQISGFDVPNAPRTTATLGYQHSFRLSNGASFIAHAEGHYTSSQWVDLLHGAGSHQESYTRSQADFSYEAASGKWRVTAWGRNLEDYGAISSYLYNVALQTQGVPLPPRTYGITATMNF